ncbi:MAG: glycosyltransferase [Prevotella sp.]|nr:glycosyltransferase [Prevotella sp.]
MKRLSIIIVTYHSEHDIYDCLDAVWTHCDLPSEQLEVIVVDNSPDSEPMFSRLRQRYGDRLTLIHNTHNGGYGQGNNVGIRHAAAPVIMIMNPDVRLYEPVMLAAVQAFEHDSSLTMLGMKQMFAPGIKSPYSFSVSYAMNGYVHTLLSAICNKIDWYLPRWMHFSGSCFFVSKQHFLSVGLFDETNFLYGEEEDIHYRLYRRYGASMRYRSNLHYIHPMHLREPDIDYERTVVEVAIKMNEKKGYPRQLTVRNRLRNVNMLIFFTRIKLLAGRASKTQLNFLYARRNMLYKYLRR